MLRAAVLRTARRREDGFRLRRVSARHSRLQCTALPPSMRRGSARLGSVGRKEPPFPREPLEDVRPPIRVCMPMRTRTAPPSGQASAAQEVVQPLGAAGESREHLGTQVLATRDDALGVPPLGCVPHVSPTQASARKRRGSANGPRMPIAGRQCTAPASAGSRRRAARIGSASAISARASGAPRQ